MEYLNQLIHLFSFLFKEGDSAWYTNQPLPLSFELCMAGCCQKLEYWVSFIHAKTGDSYQHSRTKIYHYTQFSNWFAAWTGICPSGTAEHGIDASGII
jgi:hypothetical protein